MYFKHTDQLAFEDTPNYDYLIGLFQIIINKNCIDCFYDFDWKSAYLPIKNNNLMHNKSRNVSLIANNVNGQSTLNQSRNVIENSFNNEEEGKANVFINNDNDSEENNANNIIAILHGPKHNSNIMTQKGSANQSRNNKIKEQSNPKSFNNYQIKKKNYHSRNIQDCFITVATLNQKISIDMSNINPLIHEENIQNNCLNRKEMNNENNLDENHDDDERKISFNVQDNTKTKQIGENENNNSKTLLHYDLDSKKINNPIKNNISQNKVKEEQINVIDEIKLEENNISKSHEIVNNNKKVQANNEKDYTLCKCFIY